MSSRITLEGCTPEPMARYLMALAVFRLVAEQADRNVLGWWERNAFHLESALDEEALVNFFLEQYAPTPIVAPWNSGSGFYDGDPQVGINALMETNAGRFRAYRETIQAIRAWPEMPQTQPTLTEMLANVEQGAMSKRGEEQARLRELVTQTRSEAAVLASLAGGMDLLPSSLADIESSKKGLASEAAKHVGKLLKVGRKLRTAVKKLARSSGKEEIVRACRNRLPDGAIDWIDAAVVMTSDNHLAYPPILGTAGNEGRLDYTNAFMERLASMLIGDAEGSSRSLLRNALFRDATFGMVISSVGKHDPGRAGGYNQGFGVETKDFPTNPWNFILTMEGAVAWASGVARRQGIGVARLACSPFTVRLRSVGYSSASESDEADLRATEVWMPLWDRPACFEEIRTLLREGRAEMGRRHATDGLQFAEAAVSLGVDRGITGFVRYELLKRRGDSYVALPATHFQVTERREVDLIEELDPLLAQMDSFQRDAKAPPARFLFCRRAIDQAIYDFVANGGAGLFKAILASLGRMEQYFALQDPSKPKLKRPLGGISPTWIATADDGSLEVRIAAALASIGPTGKVGPFRANLTSVDPERPWTWSASRGQTAWMGNSLGRRLANVLQRRMMDAERLNCNSNPLHSALAVRPNDVAAFLSGELDEPAAEALLFGMALVDWRDQEGLNGVRQAFLDRWARRVPVEHPIPRTWALLKHLFLPFPVRAPSGEEISVRPEPAIIPLLCGQRVGAACEIAQRRLFSAGLHPTRSAFPDGEDGIRLAAGLLVPINSVHEISRMVLDN